MALFHLEIESEYLGANTDVHVIMPDKPRTVSSKDFYSSGRKYKVLWLLHGTFGGYSDWIRKSNIELYACEKDLIVVMPGIGNADYSNWDNFTLGYDAEKYIIDELMPLIYGWFPASSAREDNFIAGLSMGGKGTLQFALLYPQLFAKAAVLSFIPSDLEERREASRKLYDMKPSQVYQNQDVMHSTQRQYNVMHKYSSFEELTPEILRSFIDKVIVHEKTKVDGHYRQTVEIVYNSVGAIDRPIWGDELDENN